MPTLESIYLRLPITLQNIACSYYGWRERKVRMGKEFKEYYKFLLSSEFDPPQKINAYQDEQIHKLITHAYHSVPYYKRVMDERGLRPQDITCRRHLEKLPVLTKEDVINNFDSLQSKVPSESQLLDVKTSGTTGTALKFKTTRDAKGFQWAVWWRFRARFGVAPFTRHLNFTGKLIAPIRQNRPPYWRWNWPMRQALVNMQHLTAEKIKDITGFADAHDFVFYSGYPSLIAQYCSLVEENDIKLNRQPSYVFLGAENVQNFQKEIISKVLGATITDQYGFSEGCGNASRCERDVYHEDWEFGALECSEGIKNKDGSHTGKILATGFSNYAFPFIRYEIGDTATWEPSSYTCECGRHSTVIREINGRNEDYVITPEGNRVMRFDYLFKDTVNIKEAQIVQREPDSITIKFVPRGLFSKNDEKNIIQKVEEWISPTLKVDFEKVSEIPRSSSGKFRPVVSELHNNKGQSE